MTEDAIKEPRLYMQPWSEDAYHDPATIWESEIEPYLDGGDDTWAVEEYTIRPNTLCFQSPKDLFESIVEWAADNGDVGETWYTRASFAIDDTALQAELAGFLKRLADYIAYSECDDLVGVHTITLDADGEPLWDGEPMYSSATEND